MEPLIWWFISHQILKSNQIASERSNLMTRAEIDWLYHVKDQVLGNVFGGIFSDSFWQNLLLHQHYYHILLSTGIFCLLVQVVYRHFCLKLVYLMITLIFLGITVKVKLTAKFCLHSFEWVYHQINNKFCLQINK